MGSKQRSRRVAMFVTTAFALVACRGSDAQRDPSPAPSTSAPATSSVATESSEAPSMLAPAPSATATTSALTSFDASAPNLRATPLTSAPALTASVSAAPSSSSALATSANAAPTASAPTPMPAPMPPAAPAARVATRASGESWVVDASAPGDCTADTDCVLVIRLEAKTPFHVNKDYPHRFDANASAGVQFLGSGEGGRVFSKKTGFFALQSETVGMIAVRFRGSAGSRASVAGTYALSVCTASTCKLESATIALAVPIK